MVHLENLNPPALQSCFSGFELVKKPDHCSSPSSKLFKKSKVNVRLLPTICRPGVFYVAKSDGYLEAWDYFSKQSDPVLTLHISDTRLSSLRIQVGPHAVASDLEQDSPEQQSRICWTLSL